MKAPANYGPCAVDGCDITARSRGYCNAHYQRVLKWGEPRADVPLRSAAAPEPGDLKCTIEGCDRKARARGWCSTHYSRWRATGDPTCVRETWQRGVPCRVDGCDLLSLSLGYCKSHYMRLWKTGEVRSDEPIKQFAEPGAGHIDANGYRRVSVEGRVVLEHRVVMEASLGRPLEPSETVHHRNGDRADNRLENLELWVSGHSGGQRVSDRVADAVTVLRRYAPDLLAPPDPAAGLPVFGDAGYDPAGMNGHGGRDG